MRCGEDTLEDCVTAHLAPGLSLAPTRKGQWSAGRCPVCQGARCLSLRIKGGKLLWLCHRDPAKCDPEIRAKLAARGVKS